MPARVLFAAAMICFSLAGCVESEPFACEEDGQPGSGPGLRVVSLESNVFNDICVRLSSGQASENFVMVSLEEREVDVHVPCEGGSIPSVRIYTLEGDLLFEDVAEGEFNCATAPDVAIRVGVEDGTYHADVVLA